MHQIKLTSLAIISCFMLTACGQMGPLYLPPQEPVKAPPPVTTTQQDTTQSTQEKLDAN